MYEVTLDLDAYREARSAVADKYEEYARRLQDLDENSVQFRFTLSFLERLGRALDAFEKAAGW